LYKHEHIKALFKVFIFTIFFHTTLLGQEIEDSINTKLYSQSSPREQVIYLNNISKSLFFEKDSVKIFPILNKSIEIAEKNNYFSLLGDAYSYRGNLYFEYGDGEKMKLNYDKSNEYFSLAEDSLGLAKVTNNIGIYYNTYINDFRRAKIYFEKSLKIKQEINIDPQLLYTTYFNLSNVYLNLNEYSKSIQYLNEAFYITSSLEKDIDICRIYHQAAKIFYQVANYKKATKYLDISDQINQTLGSNLIKRENLLLRSKILLAEGDVWNSKKATDQAEKEFIEAGNSICLADVYVVRLSAYFKNKNYKEVIDYSKNIEGLILDANRANKSLAELYNIIGKSYFELGEIESAKSYIEKSINISKRYDYFLINESNFFYLSKVLMNKNKVGQSIEYLNKYELSKDSINMIKMGFFINSTNKFAGDDKPIKKEFSLSPIESSISIEEEAENDTFLIKIIIFLVLLVIAMAFYLYYSNKKLNDKLEVVVEERTRELRESNQMLINSKKNEEDVNRMKSDLMKNISESLKTPISEIKSLIHILKDEHEDDFELYEQLDFINSSTLRLNSIISSITELYNIEDKKKVVKKDNLEINSLIGKIVDQYRFIAESRDLELKFSSTDSPVRLNLDKDLIRNSIDHLLKTLVDYASKGNIEVSILNDEAFNEITLYCSDFSINKKLFKKDLSTNSSNMGSGNKQLDRMFISLFVTKKMIEKMQGAIRWESANNDDGIKFILSFKTELVK
jgi:tetratricopeptide (TPR) repeat protein